MIYQIFSFIVRITKLILPYFFISFFLTLCTATVSYKNPIHSIISLTTVFILGSLILMHFSLDYFALLFLLVYVGAIVVLFLFIVMLIDLKMVNVSNRFSDILNFRNMVIPTLIVLFVILSKASLFSGSHSYTLFVRHQIEESYMSELNYLPDYISQAKSWEFLDVLGIALYTYEWWGIILSALLLFVSMIGAIVLTYDTKGVNTIKYQDANIQALRSPGQN
jgi:NADH:ubiquinone oxidoreductase subunit 6 (subunit J)